MNITEILEKCGKSINDIETIYFGLDHECRCGCCGKYYDKGTKPFKAALTRMKKHTQRDAGETVNTKSGPRTVQGIEYGKTFINIPLKNTNDKCFCLYFS